MPRGVVAGGLILELAERAGAIPAGVPGVCDRQLAHPAARGVEPLPVEVLHHVADSAVAEPGDRVEPVDGQLAQALKVRALAAEALEQEGRGWRPTARGNRRSPPCRGRCMVALRK
ncbi:MAG TPA: hypothetical protein VGH93_07620, partial [Solirubrobacteraceae bacterium]